MLRHFIVWSEKKYVLSNFRRLTMNSVTAQKVFGMAASWSIIGGAACLFMSASWHTTAGVAALAALIAGYSYGPREVHEAVYYWFADPGVRENICGTCAVLCLAVSWYAVWALSLFGFGFLSFSWGNLVFLLLPAAAGTVVLGLLFSVISADLREMNNFSQAALGGDYKFPITRLCSPWLICVSRICDSTLGICCYIVFLPYVALLMLFALGCIFVLDLVVTLFLMPSATARAAVMTGTFVGVMASGLGTQMGFLPIAAVVYGGIVGGSLGYGAYRLRYILVNYQLPQCAASS